MEVTFPGSTKWKFRMTGGTGVPGAEMSLKRSKQNETRRHNYDLPRVGW